MAYRRYRKGSFGLRFLLPLAILSFGPSVDAVERSLRTLDQRDGLPVNTVMGFAQDPDGFLWIGTPAGLVRYDGVEFRTWTRHPVSMFTPDMVGPNGEIVFSDIENSLFEIVADGIEPVRGPDGEPLQADWHAAAFTPDGSLWAVVGARLYRRNPGRVWIEFPTLPAEVTWFRLLKPAEDAMLYFATRSEIWKIGRDETVERVGTIPGYVVNFLPEAGGSVAVLGLRGEIASLYELPDDDPQPILSVVARPTNLVRRGGTLWAGFDRYLAAHRAGRDPEIIGPEHGLPSGGGVLVDHEGSLWVGTVKGLLHYPEPETVFWGDADGFPSSHTRYVGRHGDGIGMIAWQGIGRLVPEGSGFRAEGKEGLYAARGCIEESGVFWVSAPDGESEGRLLAEVRNWNTRHFRVPGFLYLSGCSPAANRGMWLSTNLGLLRTDARGGPPRPVPGPPGDTRIGHVTRDRLGTIWLEQGTRICAAPEDRIEAGLGQAWHCEELKDSVEITHMVESAPGRIWIGTRNGIYRRGETGWEPILASRELPSIHILGLATSPRGGIWVLAHGTVQRVADRPGLPGGWEVLETLTLWHGIPGMGGSHLYEDEDETLWITTTTGLVQVPPEARRASIEPPRVALASLQVDGKRLALDAPIDLPYRRNRLELNFAGLSFREPPILRYRLRVGSNHPWSEITDQPFFRFVDLPPGGYEVEVAASLDGENWSAAPARFEFSVGRPWFLQAWFLILSGLFGAGLLFALHRARTAFLVRLERQRTRIAMDLHDEMGSGLGSIGILAGLAREDVIEDDKRREIASRIAETSSELGTALTDIVWSLRPGSTTLDALAYHLAERANRLFPGDDATFETKFPAAFPEIGLSLAVRRNLLLIASEAMHNAARHAGAGRIVLGFAPAGHRWQLSISDDGRGIPKEVFDGGARGLGLSSMRRRAEEIGAWIDWDSDNGRGTTVTVSFEPRAEDRRLRKKRRPGRRPGALT